MSTFTYSTGMTQDLMAYLRYIVRSDPVEQAYKESTALTLMEKRGVKAEGNYIEVPVSYAGSAVGGFYDDNTALSTEDVESGAVATYELAAKAEPARMSHIAELKTKGSQALFDAWAFRVKQAKMRLRMQLATDFFAASKATNGFDPINLAFPATTTSGTYGNIDRSAKTWWQPYHAGSITWSSGGPAAMDTLETSLSVDGGPGADVYVTTATIFNKMKALARSSSYNAMNFDPTYKGKYAPQLNDMGIQSISYCGKPVVWDAYCTAQRIFAIQHASYYLGIAEDFNVVGPYPMEGSGVQAKVIYVRWAGTPICESQRKCGSLGVTG